MPEHEVSNVHRIRYPGGKDGMFRAECSCTHYHSPPRDSAYEAILCVVEHAADKDPGLKNQATVRQAARAWADYWQSTDAVKELHHD